ncbi:MAG: TolB family protein [Betaproteobacteria bacterium]
MTFLSLVKRYGLSAIFLVVVIGGAVIAFPMLQVAWNMSSLSRLYHPDPVRDIQHPRFSSDESKLVFSISNPSKVTICSLGDQKATILSPPKGSTVSNATFDPKSPRIAFVLSRKLSNGDWDHQIATSHFDGTGLKVLTSSDTQKRFPNYAFDGSKILFESKERCPGEHRAKYCRADIHEFNLVTSQERRLTDLQALQVSPASFLPGNDKIALTAYGSTYSRVRGYASRTNLEEIGDKRRVFVVALDKPDQLIAADTDTPTATSPMALPSGEIAFVSRVNAYDNVKAGYVYDIFIYGPAGTRRHTRISRYIRGYGISNSSRLVAIVAETREKPAKAELLIWNAGTERTESLQCNKFVEERQLAP